MFADTSRYEIFFIFCVCYESCSFDTHNNEGSVHLLGAPQAGHHRTHTTHYTGDFGFLPAQHELFHVFELERDSAFASAYQQFVFSVELGCGSRLLSELKLVVLALHANSQAFVSGGSATHKLAFFRGQVLACDNAHGTIPTPHPQMAVRCFIHTHNKLARLTTA